MAYKTPGVYVEEITTLAPSVVAVETAIPAFIGYTEKATDGGGDNLRFVPTRIKSLLEYQSLFGGDFVPATYRVVLDATAGNAVGAVSPRNADGTRAAVLPLQLRASLFRQRRRPLLHCLGRFVRRCPRCWYRHDRIARWPGQRRTGR